MNVKSRLLYFARTYQPQVEEFALNVFGNSHFFSIDQGVTLENILKLSYHHPELNMNWLFTGKGDVIYQDIRAFPNHKTEALGDAQEVIIEEWETQLKVKQKKMRNLRKLFLEGFFHVLGDFNAESKFQKKFENYKLFNQLLDRKNNQLFNAFILSKPNLFEKKGRIDYECMKSVFEEFYQYLNELDKMGKHEIYSE